VGIRDIRADAGVHGVRIVGDDIRQFLGFNRSFGRIDIRSRDVGDTDFGAGCCSNRIRILGDDFRKFVSEFIGRNTHCKCIRAASLGYGVTPSCHVAKWNRGVIDLYHYHAGAVLGSRRVFCKFCYNNFVYTCDKSLDGERGDDTYSFY